MLNRRSFMLATLAAPVVIGSATPAFAMTPEVFAPEGLAIRGYDPVAYFDGDGPVAGLEVHSLEWKGAEWRFVSEENKTKFMAEPDVWAPQYGGYCAYAVANGYTAKTEPEAWSLHDGKLYLNFSLSVRALWAVRKRHFIAQADANWPEVLNA